MPVFEMGGSTSSEHDLLSQQIGGISKGDLSQIKHFRKNVLEIDDKSGFAVYRDSENTDFRILNGLLITLPAYVVLFALVFFLLYIMARRYRRKRKHILLRMDRQIKRF